MIKKKMHLSHLGRLKCVICTNVAVAMAIQCVWRYGLLWDAGWDLCCVLSIVATFGQPAALLLL